MLRRSNYLGAALLGTLCSCSLVVDNFHECNVDSDCSQDKVCQSNYCIAIPAGCNGVPDAGVLAVYGQPTASNAIHLGALLNITNANGTIDNERIQHLNAIVLALNEINGRGVDGRPFALHVCDNANDMTLLTAQTHWMIEKLGVPAVIVTATTPVVTVAPLTDAAGVLLMSPTATSPEITSLGGGQDGGIRLVWRTAPSDAIQAEVITGLLTGTGPFDAGLATANQIGVLYENDTYGQDLEALLLDDLFAAKSGAQSVQSFSYVRDEDVSGALAALTTFAPNLTVQISFPEDVPRILDAGVGTPLSRANGHQWFFTDSAKDPSIIANSPQSEIQGCYGTTPAQGAGAAYALFRNDFMTAYPGIDPNDYAFTSHSYDAMYCLALSAAHALGSGGTGTLNGSTMAIGMTQLSSGTVYQLSTDNFDAMTSALENGTSIDIEGASGHLDFDPSTGEAPSPIELWQVDGGSFQTAAIIDLSP